MISPRRFFSAIRRSCEPRVGFVRRRDAGGAVLAPVLRRCDTDGVPAALVAPAWAVVRFARGLGFEVVQATRSADGQLPLWVVVRPPGVPMPEL